MAPCSIIQTINKIQTNQINAEILKQYEIQNNIKYIEPRAILTNIISVFPSAKHVPYFASRKFKMLEIQDNEDSLGWNTLLPIERGEPI